jgi:hypothetical protein
VAPVGLETLAEVLEIAAVRLLYDVAEIGERHALVCVVFYCIQVNPSHCFLLCVNHSILLCIEQGSTKFRAIQQNCGSLVASDKLCCFITQGVPHRSPLVGLQD